MHRRENKNVRRENSRPLSEFCQGVLRLGREHRSRGLVLSYTTAIFKTPGLFCGEATTSCTEKFISAAVTC